MVADGPRTLLRNSNRSSDTLEIAASALSQSSTFRGKVGGTTACPKCASARVPAFSMLQRTPSTSYAILLEFFLEMAENFPDPVLMLGGNEAGLSCTNSTGGEMASHAFDLDLAD